MSDGNDLSVERDAPASENGGTKKLTALVARLEGDGADARRLTAARCALAFKRSWIELAAALADIRKAGGAVERWGYQDLMAYAAGELGLRRATVDKLLVSYATLQKHAPGRICGDEDGNIPSYQALDYLARATGELRATGKPPRDAPETAPSGEVLHELQSAVFDEGQSVRQLRDRFDPVIRPRTPEQQQQLALRRLSAAARHLLVQLDEVEDLDESPAPDLQDVIETLREQAEALTEQLKSLAA